MRIVSKGTLKDFWTVHASAEGPLKAWFAEAKTARWQSFNDVKARFGSADWVGNGRVVFNIGGNNYRLVVHFRFKKGFGYIRFIGTHEEYNKIDAKKV